MFNTLLNDLVDRKSPGDKVAIQGLKGSYLSYLISNLVRRGHGPFLVLTASPAEAETLLKDIRFYLNDPFKALAFPSWEILPYENLSPHPDITGERLATLYSLLTSSVDVIVSPLPAIMQRLIPTKLLHEMADYVISGEEAPFNEFIKGMINRGYARVGQVDERGEFSVRGGIVDVFGPHMEFPHRIEFFGDEIQSIRSFDLETQRSRDESVEDLIILPASEIYLSPDRAGAVAGKIRGRSKKMEIPRNRLNEILQGFDEGLYFLGVEFFLPDFFDETSTFFDYLPAKTTIIKVDEMELKAQAFEFEKVIGEGYEKGVNHLWPFPEPGELYLQPEEIMAGINSWPSISAGGVVLDEGKILNSSLESNGDLRAELIEAGKSGSPLSPLARRIEGWHDEGMKVFFAAHSLGQAERLAELLAHYKVNLTISKEEACFDEGKDLTIYMGELSAGFRDRDNRLVLITEEEVFGERHKRRTNLRKSSDVQLTSFGQLHSDDYIIHLDHGIGIYRGLKKVAAGGIEADYLELEYLGGDKVFLPVDRLNLVQRFSGGGDKSISLDKLGGRSWEKVKGKVKKAVTDLALELLEIQAARKVMDGFAYSKGGETFKEFEASFEYEETPDQRAAIDDIIRDMESSRPLDRLVCGDVGYGKTEVAVRASFKAVMDGRQVVVLVPTTILAQQHHQTFEDRFKGYPVIIERLSRFCSKAKQKDVLERLKDGKVDILIGTHRLLQKDVVFKNLGLIIIDEEQRFGVSHKEKLKKIKKVVDVLTLTATPIPRTLNMAMMGIRDLSIISSPPEGRLAIKNYLGKFDEETVRDAVLRELRRGGQIFFVHNRVQDIENVAARIKAIVPEANIAIGHGQMAEHALEKVMIGFYEGKTNLLLCTTIIESGLDIPAANTIIINNAQNMGLGQLYQLRGRVGRSKHRAYAYFLFPGEALLTKDARKRFQAIQEMTELSSGFHLASYDMEIRGAGNLLGAEQSGNIEAVGFDLFTTMLEKAVADLKGEGLKDEIEPEIKFPYPAFIPGEYVTDTSQRLTLYKRFSSLKDEEDLKEMRVELLDRFGPIPREAIYFIALISFKILLKEVMIKEAAVSEKSISLIFHEKAEINVDKLLLLIKESPKKYSVSPDMRFKMMLTSNDLLKGLEEGKNILKGLI
ncbi:MAG: transcription-repair coupling factor [Proteobacteria bacterium]|nr:transcription-repair coupling factor [Pseudomonadota bacterium]